MGKALGSFDWPVFSTTARRRLAEARPVLDQLRALGAGYSFPWTVDQLTQVGTAFGQLRAAISPFRR